MANPSAVTPGEDRIRLLYRMRARPLFWRMMTKQGIDPTGPWWHGAERMVARAAENCGACRHVQVCRQWLDNGSAAAGVPSFCPNGRAIEAARIMDPRALPLADDRGPAPSPEPSLDDLLVDPIVRLLMKADRVNSEILRRAMTDRPRFAAAFATPTLRLGPRPR